MEEMLLNIREGINYVADVVVEWEVEQLGKLIAVLIETAIVHMDFILPLAGIIALFKFKPTKPFAWGTIIIGLLMM